MHPVLTWFHFGGIDRPIGSYGVMLALAILVGSSLTVRAASRAKIDTGAVIATLGFSVGGGLLGAWLLFVVVEWFRTGDVLSGLGQPGLVFLGGPVGGGLVMWLSCRSMSIPIGRLADVALPALPAAHALGRLGCFLGGCCFGKPWQGSWQVVYTHAWAPAAHPSVPRHPTPLYEAGGLLLLAFVFALVPMGRVGRARRFLLYAVAYGVLRVLTEATRGDSVRGLLFGGALSTSQLLSGVLVAGALLALALVRPVAPIGEKG